MPCIVEVVTTLETQEQAESLAEQLIEHRFAACVQIAGPIKSVYRWEGKVCKSEEFRCSIKTTAEALPQVKAHMEKYHPYDTPEVLVFESQDVSPNYEAWALAQIGPAS